MTITTLHESGSAEGFDLTLKYNINANWSSSNTGSQTPTMYSASGTNVAYSWPKTFGTNEIHFNLDDLEIPNGEANGDTWHRMKSIVYIDIFARDSTLGKLFCREVNRIIWDVLKPNASTRIVKSDGSSNSAINSFDKTTIMWKKEKFLHPQQSLYVHYSGQVEIIWYQTRS